MVNKVLGVQEVSLADVSASGVFYGPGDKAVDDEQKELCRRWITDCCRPSRKFYERAQSYRLKHVVEKWCGQYVSNGAFIAAALELGYDARRCHPRSVNVYLALVIKVVRSASVAPKLRRVYARGEKEVRGRCIYSVEGEQCSRRAVAGSGNWYCVHHARKVDYGFAPQSEIDYVRERLRKAFPGGADGNL